MGIYEVAQLMPATLHTNAAAGAVTRLLDLGVAILTLFAVSGA